MADKALALLILTLTISTRLILLFQKKLKRPVSSNTSLLRSVTMLRGRKNSVVSFSRSARRICEGKMQRGDASDQRSANMLRPCFGWLPSNSPVVWPQCCQPSLLITTPGKTVWFCLFALAVSRWLCGAMLSAPTSQPGLASPEMIGDSKPGCQPRPSTHKRGPKEGKRRGARTAHSAL